MALLQEQIFIAKVIGYEPITEDEGMQQYPADVDFQDAPKGAIACTGNVHKNKKGILRCYWIPAGGNYSSQDKDDLTGWYDVPTLEGIEEWTFDSICFTPCDDEVEPDHPDSWLSILGLIQLRTLLNNICKSWAFTYSCDVSPRVNPTHQQLHHD